MAKGQFSQIELKKMLTAYRKKLESRNIPVSQIYLYGSYAKGQPNGQSDIDICVISPTFNDRIESTMTLMKLRDDDELLISPIAFSPNTFTDENPLAWEIKQTGILIEKASLN